MPEKQTNPAEAAPSQLGVDLLLDFRGGHLRLGLLNALREAVRSGRLAPGTTLPASRTLAADLGVSRSTVTECYSSLVAEGWLTARQGSGTRVASPVRPRPTSRPAPRVTGLPARVARGLVPGAPEFADFPRQPWLAAARRALATAPVSAFGYGDPVGSPALRAALADYLGRVRGVRADPEQIVICSGFHEGLGLVARALRDRRARTVAVESYGLDLYRGLLLDAGFDIPPLEVDSDGARTGDLHDTGADAVLLTPAHQFPTGVALSSERRATARDWARSTGGLILEDDYDGEFRYDRNPVGALQGLVPERVVYFGTASKSLAPALRVAWVVVPHDLLEEVRKARGPVDVVSAVDQLTLTEFITSGAFDRHIRSRRAALRRRQSQLVAELADRAPQVSVSGLAAGLQAVLQVPADTERHIMRMADARGLHLSALSEFRHKDARLDPDTAGLVVNFSAVADSAWSGALELLCEVVSGALRG